jgi:hypothetical protein
MSYFLGNFPTISFYASNRLNLISALTLFRIKNQYHKTILSIVSMFNDSVNRKMGDFYKSYSITADARANIDFINKLNKNCVFIGKTPKLKKQKGEGGRYRSGTFCKSLGLGRDREQNSKNLMRWDGSGFKILGLGGFGTEFWYC